MIGQTVRLVGPTQKTFAKRLIDAAPDGAILNIREGTRTIDQNSLLWVLLSEIARAKPQGRVLSTDVWKSLFMAACGHQVRFEPSLDGNGVVPMGFRSSRLTKAEMSDLIECIYAYGAEHNVPLSDTDEREAA
jgi:hypothetical protein